MAFVSRGFRGRRRRDVDPSRVPPGQYVVEDFPVLSAGPTPRTETDDWSFQIDGEVDDQLGWTWDEFMALPQETVTVDIHCVTKWTKLDTAWTGVSVYTLLGGIDTEAEHVVAWCDGDYTTNIPLDDVTGSKAWLVHTFDGEPLGREHGGAPRALVPPPYFLENAKGGPRLTLTGDDPPGFLGEGG